MPESTDTVRDELYFGLLQQFREARGDGGEGKLLLVSALGTTEVRGEQHLSALLREVLDGGNSPSNASVVSYLPFLAERDVQVDANQHSVRRRHVLSLD